MPNDLTISPALRDRFKLPSYKMPSFLPKEVTQEPAPPPLITHFKPWEDDIGPVGPVAVSGEEIIIEGINFNADPTNDYIVVGPYVTWGPDPYGPPQPDPNYGPELEWSIQLQPNSSSLTSLTADTPTVPQLDEYYSVRVMTLNGGWSNPVKVFFRSPSIG